MFEKQWAKQRQLGSYCGLSHNHSPIQTADSSTPEHSQNYLYSLMLLKRHLRWYPQLWGNVRVTNQQRQQPEKRHLNVLLDSGQRIKSESPTFQVSAPANEPAANSSATCSPSFFFSLKSEELCLVPHQDECQACYIFHDTEFLFSCQP